MSKASFAAFGALLAAVLPLSGCGTLAGWSASTSWQSASGPSRAQMEDLQDEAAETGIQLVEVNDEVARKLIESQQKNLFSDTLGTAAQPGFFVGPGDVVEVSVWEAPPGTLFSSSASDPNAGPATTRMTVFPEQMVNTGGTVNIPFAGSVPVAGRTPQQIEAEIVRRLQGKANQPQALVRVTRNNTATVTVIGEVASSLRMPLTARGERLLDSLAAAGGVRQPVNKTTLQITRGGQVESLPLDTVIRDPRQNIPLQPGDVVTALFQPFSFNALGATGKNEEVPFEAQGISLAQALARAGGLQDGQSDPLGVFIFRLESPGALPWKSPPAMTPDGKVPVVYRLNLRDPATFFVAQGFPIQNKDVVYVSNAPGAELQKFMRLVMTAVYPALSVINAAKGFGL
jgi:polysaccharide export outer membrane protein